jgi:thiol-disulfide isomerase/thioredoxin
MPPLRGLRVLVPAFYKDVAPAALGRGRQPVGFEIRDQDQEIRIRGAAQRRNAPIRGGQENDFERGRTGLAMLYEEIVVLRGSGRGARVALVPRGGQETVGQMVQKWISPEPDRKGKFVLIDFWATWCPPCRETVPELNGFQQKFADKLVVIGISDETEEVVRKFTTENIKYSSALDTNGTLKKQYEVTGIPHCVIINPAGTVVWEGFPLLDGYKLTEDVVAALLK